MRAAHAPMVLYQREGSAGASSVAPGTKRVHTHSHSNPPSSRMVATSKPDAMGKGSTTFTSAMFPSAHTHDSSDATASAPPA